MSEEFEDVSVDVVVPVADTAPVGGTDAPVAAAPESMSAEIEATQVNLDPADNVLTNNAQQVYNEVNAPERVSEAAPALTEQAKAAKQTAKEEHEAAVLEAEEQRSIEAKRREEWLEKEHDFGGMKMSGHDLDKLIHLYANNPQMQDQLKDRLVKSGKTTAQADKAVQEFNEYMKILKKESEGKQLTDEEKRRKEVLSKDEGVRLAAQEATRLAQAQGVDITPKMQEAQAKTHSTLDNNNIERADIKQEITLLQANVAKVAIKQSDGEDLIDVDIEDTPKAATKVAYVSATARENFPNAPAMMEDFATSSSGNLVAMATAPKISLNVQGIDAETDDTMSSVPVAAVSMSQKMPLQPSARA